MMKQRDAIDQAVGPSARWPDRAAGRGAAALAVAAWLAGAGGCAQLAPGTWQPGTTIQQARGAVVQPSGEYPLPGGGTRLEYAQGAFGRQTWMLDYDASGRLVAKTQVLDEANFATIEKGMSTGDVLVRLGRPAQVFNIGWQRQTVWNYRWFGGDCVWFQVSIDQATQRVSDSGTGQDPACDVRLRD